MKLSEAILLGSVGSEQCKGWLIDGNKACAMGAALIAVGEGYLGMPHGISSTILPSKIYVQWPWATQGTVECPICKEHGYKQVGLPYIMVEHLNDLHGWTRPRIAEWVASIEPKEVEQPQVTEVQDLAQTIGR